MPPRVIFVGVEDSGVGRVSEGVYYVAAVLVFCETGLLLACLVGGGEARVTNGSGYRVILLSVGGSGWEIWYFHFHVCISLSKAGGRDWQVKAVVSLSTLHDE